MFALLHSCHNQRHHGQYLNKYVKDHYENTQNNLATKVHSIKKIKKTA